MAERVTMYQAADGSMHESEYEANQHDSRNAIRQRVDQFVEENVSYRTVSKSKLKTLMEDFAMNLIFPPLESEETRPEPEGHDPQE